MTNTNNLLICNVLPICSLKPLFPGSNEVDQITKIHDIIGTPNTELLSKMRRLHPYKIKIFIVKRYVVSLPY